MSNQPWKSFVYFINFSKLGNLSENNIKKTALSFLKSYYKHRPRSSESGRTDAEIDMRGKGGIIADGYIAFKKDDGGAFTSTFEATSSNTKDEVRYKLQIRKLLWDGIAIGSVAAGIYLLWNYYWDRQFLENTGYVTVAATLFLIAAVLWIFWIGLFRGLKRYKYIYAIEQFKQYYADEQWIAIGEDVFLSPEDQQFKELKDQVIDHGIGLIQIDKELKPQLLITPARQDAFKKKREVVNFLSLGDFSNRISQVNYKKFLGIFKLKSMPFKLDSNQWRFRAKNSLQISLAALSWTMVFVIFLRELNRPTIVYVNEETYYEEMLANKENLTGETIFYIVDTLLVQPYDENTLPYLQLMELENRSNKVATVTRRGFDIIIGLKNSQKLYVYSCERFYNLNTPKYIIEDGVYFNLDEAIDRIEFLNDHGIQATALWLGCFNDGGEGFSLFFDEIQNTQSDVNELLLDYEKQIRSLEKFEKKLHIRTLIPID